MIHLTYFDSLLWVEINSFPKCLFLFTDQRGSLEWLAQISKSRLQPMLAFLWRNPPKMSKTERENMKLSVYMKTNKKKIAGPVMNYMDIHEREL